MNNCSSGTSANLPLYSFHSNLPVDAQPNPMTNCWPSTNASSILRDSLIKVSSNQQNYNFNSANNTIINNVPNTSNVYPDYSLNRANDQAFVNSQQQSPAIYPLVYSAYYNPYYPQNSPQTVDYYQNLYQSFNNMSLINSINNVQYSPNNLIGQNLIAPQQPVHLYFSTDEARNDRIMKIYSASRTVPSVDVNNFRPAKYFVIKCTNEDNLHRSIKYGVWCSTQRGNQKLSHSFREMERVKGFVLLFFSVNGSRHFCGVGLMRSDIRPSQRHYFWYDSPDRWTDEFAVDWLFVKDVPNSKLRHIKVETNEFKPVTNSRDCTEILPSVGGENMLEIMTKHQANMSLFSDWNHYEQRELEQMQAQSSPITDNFNQANGAEN